MKPKVTLLSWTGMPLETIYAVWEASKGTEELRTPWEIKLSVQKEEIEKLFRAIIAQRIPIGEHINFVFMMEGVSVSWREQAVRHRIGTCISPERTGMDIIPNLATSSWWSQSMRIQDMGDFYNQADYRIPDTLKDKVVPAGHGRHSGRRAANLFDDFMCKIQGVYNALVASGVPMEDAREIIPLGAQHRISWSLNMSSLQHIVGERGCWILQLGLWGPIINGIVNELAEKVNPIFRELVTPPCIRNEKFGGCVYMEECRRRLVGEDGLPPCPLHLNYHNANGEIFDGAVPMKDAMGKRAEEYRMFWGRNPNTGVKE